MEMMSSIALPPDMYLHSLFTWNMFKSVRTSIMLELQISARIDHTAPNPSLVSTDGLSYRRLLSFCRGNRPLVVNFCSWTCPVFRARVGEFLSVVQEFSDVADFLTIYIEEAHPSNGWAFENNVVIPTHQSLEDRCKAARLMLSSTNFNCPVVVDTMENEANRAYAGVPIRLYVIKNQKVALAGLTGPTFYDPKQVAQWLTEFKAEFIRTSSARHRA
ncbi:thyroxine 5'-deiodinase [Desmophyllum pertusum]|uniref:Iodothyronine deiodinase n=1 Tax=Desmophyllum pertusum TaxID=174260 RepID=A0A9W9Y933_9CNID|nr:thyroxine 5'-deiodinase [Desmophyllum pertusum]